MLFEGCDALRTKTARRRKHDKMQRRNRKSSSSKKGFETKRTQSSIMHSHIVCTLAYKSHYKRQRKGARPSTQLRAATRSSSSNTYQQQQRQQH